jgi:hypothetical protein
MPTPIDLRPARRVQPWRAIALLWAAGLGAVNTGCSFVFIDGPPTEHAKMSYFDCTSTYGLPVADGLLALTGALGAGEALSQSKQAYADKNSGASRNAAAGVDLTLAALGAVSAVYGVVQTERCDRAKEALKARIFAPTPPRPELPFSVPAPPPTAPPPPVPAPPSIAPPPTAPPASASPPPAAPTRPPGPEIEPSAP